MSDLEVANFDLVALRARIATVRSRVAAAATRSGRSGDDVTIVAVSKTHPRPAVDAVCREGIAAFGENRVQEACDKFAVPLPPGTALHLIGQLQSNKARLAAGLFSCIETVDRPSLVDALERENARLAKVQSCLIQVNVAREPQKSGCTAEDAKALLEAVVESPHLHCEGLMTIAPLVVDVEDARATFSALRELRDRLEATIGVELPTLSMGMSNDFEVAIAEGATHVRLGRSIFGAR